MCQCARYMVMLLLLLLLYVASAVTQHNRHVDDVVRLCGFAAARALRAQSVTFIGGAII